MEQIQQMSWTQVLVAGIILTVICYFTVYASGTPWKRRILTVRQHIAAEQTQLKKIQQALAEKKKLENEIDLVTGEFKHIRKYLPTELDESNLMGMIMDVARSVGTDDIKIQPESGGTQLPTMAKSKVFYAPVKIDIDFVGTFSQVMKFLAGATQIPRLLNVAQIKLTNDKAGLSNGSPILNFHGVLVGYRYIQKAKKSGNGHGK